MIQTQRKLTLLNSLIGFFEDLGPSIIILRDHREKRACNSKIITNHQFIHDISFRPDSSVWLTGDCLALGFCEQRDSECLEPSSQKHFESDNGARGELNIHRFLMIVRSRNPLKSLGHQPSITSLKLCRSVSIILAKYDYVLGDFTSRL
jgi:hypothetical protein